MLIVGQRCHVTTYSVGILTFAGEVNFLVECRWSDGDCAELGGGGQKGASGVRSWQTVSKVGLLLKNK